MKPPFVLYRHLRPMARIESFHDSLKFPAKTFQPSLDGPRRYAAFLSDFGLFVIHKRQFEHLLFGWGISTEQCLKQVRQFGITFIGKFRLNRFLVADRHFAILGVLPKPPHGVAAFAGGNAGQ